MATNMTYNGRDTSLPYDDLIVEGLEPWPAGETRLFDDAYAAAHGWRSGDEFAEYIDQVYTRNRAASWFTRRPASGTASGGGATDASASNTSDAAPTPDTSATTQALPEPAASEPDSGTLIEQSTLAPPPQWPQFGASTSTEAGV